MKKNKAGEESTDGGAALGDLGKTLIRCYLSKDLKEVRERVCGHAEKEQFRQKEGHRQRPRRAVAGVSEEWQGGGVAGAQSLGSGSTELEGCSQRAEINGVRRAGKYNELIYTEK